MENKNEILHVFGDAFRNNGKMCIRDRGLDRLHCNRSDRVNIGNIISSEVKAYHGRSIIEKYV